MANRDDRTIRSIARLVGDGLADLTFTHFLTSTVQLSVNAATLSMPNGLLALATTTNMLTRFVGTVKIAVVGHPGGRDHELQTLLADLRMIDSRPGKTIELAYSLAPPQPTVRLHIGEASGELLANPIGTTFVSFDGWTVTLRRDTPVGPVTSSHIPFGALAGSCFGAAEVFKAILADVAPDQSLSERLRHRVVRNFRYSTWRAERLDIGEPEVGLEPPDAIPPVDVSGILQVGAGAVGNASMLGVSGTAAAGGQLSVLDSKVVDEKNLNRCLYFRESDIGEMKARVVAARASRERFVVDGIERPFSPSDGDAWLLLSTVDNNEARHVMQEAVPQHIVQGSTAGTSVCVSVHTAVDGLSCLVCRHPDRQYGLARRVSLSIEDMASTVGVPEEVIRSSTFRDSGEISPEFILEVERRNPNAAEYFARERTAGRDLCGAIGDFRLRYGFTLGPQEPSVPFASAFAGVQAAAEAVKLALVRSGSTNVPVLSNVLTIDLAFDYTRTSRLSFADPRRSDCEFCCGREELVRRVYGSKWGKA